MKKLIIKESQLGKAVFSNQNLKKDEYIIEFKGALLKSNELPEINNPEDDRYIQVEKNIYMGPSGGYDDFFNHSCDPNAGVIFQNGKVILKSIKAIQKNEEITWDYSTTMDEDDWKMNCLCGNKNCRKIIKDFKHLPKKIQNKYTQLGIVPDYILKIWPEKSERAELSRELN